MVATVAMFVREIAFTWSSDAVGDTTLGDQHHIAALKLLVEFKVTDWCAFLQNATGDWWRKQNGHSSNRD